MNVCSQLRFPPGVSLERHGQRYIIFRHKSEEVGGVVLTETSLGDTQLRPYLISDKENDKVTVAFVAQQISDVLFMLETCQPIFNEPPNFPSNN
ncbi:hypothetical protein J8L86_20185 [Shewanella sp. MMG014]|uniref:hypothetical protein n=1 Tax=Shewanella sp. MMG014 TaxID=2822691 RepID=UPI001B380C9E|nr:hypothetical protein [Shewanella sp. MMG014]MBQ4892176.1 hypothetical protein [Shewanella sp. MMG014]